MNSRPDQEEIGIAVASHRAQFRRPEIKAAYDWTLRSLSEMGISPTQAAGSGEKHFRDFRRVRARIEQGIEEGKGWSVRHLRKERDVSNWDFWDYTASAVVGTLPGAGDKRQWFANFAAFPADVPIDEKALFLRLVEFARMTVQRYGYICYYRRRELPAVSAIAMGAWLAYFPVHSQFSILRDIYPTNFLAREYLDLPIQRTTLGKWIEAGRFKGRFETFNDQVMMWEPPVERIPELRETLFREGLILCAEFFDPDSPWRRDLSKPAKPFTGPIPEAFQAATYVGTDPRLSPTTF